MRQIGAEKDDPLKRIQEEINEVARRERELREKSQNQSETGQSNAVVVVVLNDETTTISPSTSPTPSQSVSQDDTPSLASSVNSKESLDEQEQHSDDSGISASSSPINGVPSSATATTTTSSSSSSSTNHNNGIKKYIRTNGYNSIPSPPPQKLLTRAVSTPQIHVPSRRITFGPAQKGLMQRFIASRGKIAAANYNNQNNYNNNNNHNNHNNHNNNNNNNNQNNNNNNNMTKDMGTPISSLDYPRQSIFMPTTTMTPPIIERDPDGKPIRRGYVPVEEKIQKELKDLKNRETELKKIRRLSTRQSQPDLLDSIDNEISDSDEDSDVEHCYPPGKLRSSKSISELCESVTSNSLSPRTTPSPHFDRRRVGGGLMRPAVSLAQLCDLSPADEAPSSHQLIAKWESLIQQNA